MHHKPTRGSLFLCRILMLALTLAWTATAQTGRGTIAGRVIDSSGAAVAGVKITILNTETRVVVSPVTNNAGYYQADALIPGPYEGQAEVTGFKKFSRAGITLASEAHDCRHRADRRRGNRIHRSGGKCNLIEHRDSYLGQGLRQL